MDDYAHSEDEGSAENRMPRLAAAGTDLAQDKTLFADWLRDQREDAYKKSHDSNAGGMPWFDPKDTGDASIIISSPREYQTELFERAKEKNIIAVLDTGCLSSVPQSKLCRLT